MPSKRAGVVGHPVAHSKSPLLHRAAYQALSVDVEYSLNDVEPGGLSAFVSALDETWVGLSVTMPHKVDALALSTKVDLMARLSEAVNTLVFVRSPDGDISSIEGYNTDVEGIVRSLADIDAVTAHHGAVIGSGATASSAIVALAQLGVEHVSVLARNVDRAQLLQSVAHQVGMSFSAHSVEAMNEVDHVEVAVCALPGTVQLSLDSLPRTSGAALLDVAYDPWPSSRGLSWEERGGFAVSGLRMLAHQAVTQVRLFTSGDAELPLPDEDPIRRQMFEAVGLY